MVVAPLGVIMVCVMLTVWDSESRLKFTVSPWIAFTTVPIVLRAHVTL